MQAAPGRSVGPPGTLRRYAAGTGMKTTNWQPVNLALCALWGVRRSKLVAIRYVSKEAR